MRKIDKSEQLSTAYKSWENNLETNNLPHPRYNSSQGEYYKDIVMDALRCQNGLCAYTEVQLCPPQYLTAENWENGRYTLETRTHNGQLEHFDESLKYKSVGNKQKDWLWSNFFVIDSDTNIIKKAQKVDYILKPDGADYDPFRLLDYSFVTHRYIASYDFDDATRKRIKDMIDLLGLNFPNVVDKRRQVVERVVKYPLERDFEREFPTAVAFFKGS